MSRSGANPWRRATPLAMAHRGQRATRPEQTLEAYREAIALGAEAIECDVQRTRDGRLAMFHDLTLDRTTDGHGPIAHVDWDDLRRLDAGSWFDPRFAGLRVPSLEDTLDLAVSAGIPLCIEIKGSAADAPATAEVVTALLRERELLDRMLVSSFDHAALAAATGVAPEVFLAPERLPPSGPPDPETAVAQATALGAAVLQHRWEDLTVEVVEALHAVGVAVWSWPVDSLESIAHSVAVGVDGIIGDDVPLLREGLARAFAPAPRREPS
jgi:glycerophosphoryl diester phosphodiesterase